MSKSEKVYLCKACGKNDSEVKFYEYLNTKCIECKIKSVKESKKSKEKEVRDEKIEKIDPDEKIRFLWSEMVKEPFYRNGRKSILDFMEETDQDISDLVMSGDKIKVECFAGIDVLKDKFNTFQKEINHIIDVKVYQLKKEIYNELKREIIDELKKI
jgi:hypothetical protein